MQKKFHNNHPQGHRGGCGQGTYQRGQQSYYHQNNYDYHPHFNSRKHEPDSNGN